MYRKGILSCKMRGISIWGKGTKGIEFRVLSNVVGEAKVLSILRIDWILSNRLN